MLSPVVFPDNGAALKSGVLSLLCSLARTRSVIQMSTGQTSRGSVFSAKRVCGGLKNSRFFSFFSFWELEQLYHQSLSVHPSFLSLSLSNYISLEHLPLTLGLSRSLLYPLVGNQPHARKQSSAHMQVCTNTHMHTILHRHGAERNFYQRSFVFQVVISSHCCCSANQKSHTPMRVIISPSGKGRKKRPAWLREDAERCARMWYVLW